MQNSMTSDTRRIFIAGLLGVNDVVLSQCEGRLVRDERFGSDAVDTVFRTCMGIPPPPLDGVAKQAGYVTRAREGVA
jgi:hypothetical protein